MAAITKNSSYKPSLATLLPANEHQFSGNLAGEAISAGDLCYIHTDRTVRKATGAAANNAAIVWGMAASDTQAGQSCTIFYDVNFGYIATADLSPGTFLYLSASVAGGLDTATSTNVTQPCAMVLEKDKIRVLRMF